MRPPSIPMSERWRVGFAWLRANRRELGLCERCGDPARPRKTTCEPCGAKQSAAVLARYYAKTGRTPKAVA